MEHELAVKNQAVERYFLGEMPPGEQNEFEEHYFSCALCAEDVRATATFLERAKPLLASPLLADPLRKDAGKSKPERASSPGWFAWLHPSVAYAAGLLACAGLIGYQNFEVIPKLEAPQSIGPAVPLDGATRSAGPKLRAGTPLDFELPWDRGGAAFVELRHGSSVIESGAVAAPAPHQPLDVYFPAKLNPGHYAVAVRALDEGRPGQELMENEFDVVPGTQ